LIPCREEVVAAIAGECRVLRCGPWRLRDTLVEPLAAFEPRIVDLAVYAGSAREDDVWLAAGDGDLRPISKGAALVLGFCSARQCAGSAANAIEDVVDTAAALVVNPDYVEIAGCVECDIGRSRFVAG